jgi:hypothetical protein
MLQLGRKDRGLGVNPLAGSPSEIDQTTAMLAEAVEKQYVFHSKTTCRMLTTSIHVFCEKNSTLMSFHARICRQTRLRKGRR